MTRYQTAACIIVTAINIASLVVVALAVIGRRPESSQKRTGGP